MRQRIRNVFFYLMLFYRYIHIKYICKHTDLFWKRVKMRYNLSSTKKKQSNKISEDINLITKGLTISVFMYIYSSTQIIL